eukprot:scaffold7_cov142-Skeletonema_menzelii.AAC.9
MQCLFISKYVSTSSLEGRLPTSTYDNAIIHGYKTSCTIQFPAKIDDGLKRPSSCCGRRGWRQISAPRSLFSQVNVKI